MANADSRVQVQMSVVSPCPQSFAVRIWGVVLRSGAHSKTMIGSALAKDKEPFEVEGVLQGLKILKYPCDVTVCLTLPQERFEACVMAAEGRLGRQRSAHRVRWQCVDPDHPDILEAWRMACVSAREMEMVWSIMGEEDPPPKKSNVIPFPGLSLLSGQKGSRIQSSDAEHWLLK